MHRYLAFALGLIVLVVILAPSLDNLTNRLAAADGNADGAAPGAPVVASAGAIPAGGDGPLVVTRDAQGSFRADTTVNGQGVRMLVDTGADSLALSEADAERIGVLPDPSTYSQVVTTASGPGYGARVRLQTVQIGGHRIEDVDAVVVRGLGTSLLGQSVLRRIGTVTIIGDRMTIGG